MFLQQSGAFIEKTFKKGFILKEEALYRIKDIIEKRIKENPDNKRKASNKDLSKKESKNDFYISFSIKRDDGLMFITLEIQKIVDEYNGKDKTINEIKISACPKDFLIFDKNIDIIFNKKSGVTIKISGYSLDFINLLYSDLEEYLGNSVLKGNQFCFKKRRIPFISFSMILYLYYILFKIIFTKNNVEDVIASDDIIEKINFLLKRYQEYYGLGGDILNEVLYILGIVTIAFIITYGYDFLFPKNIFYMGEWKNIYDRKINLRKFIIGTILIGGILTPIIVSRFTGKFTN